MPYVKHGLLLSSFLILFVINSTTGFAANHSPLSLLQAQQVLLEINIAQKQMPLLDNAALIQRDFAINNSLAIQKPILQFAEPQPTTITPESHGSWETVNTADGESLIWRMTISSAGAISMNLGFTQFFMPQGAELYLYSPSYSQVIGPFTEKNNNQQGQLWTPIINGDTIIIEVNLPASEQANLILELTKVNHGYQKISTKANTSGSCNVDVVCPQGNNWLDQTRSVAVYSFGGARVCSGTAINNTAQDNTPYFLTADHCKVDVDNAASLVIYWNYQNSVCRTASAIANPGDGVLTQFTLGTTFIADFATSDFTLVKLNQPIPPDFNVFLAGWDRTTTVPETAVTIHHPNVEEKRISIAPPSFTIVESRPFDQSGFIPNSHLRVVRWAQGATEGGSSGSPLFDQNKRIVGQLFGGSSACSSNNPNNANGKSDWFGRFNISWDGGGTANSRLSDWLDPLNTGVTFLNGKNVNNAQAGNVTQLVNSVPQLISLGAAKSSQVFTITVPTGAQNLQITTQGSDADADLYLKFASNPSLILFDSRSWSDTSNDAILLSTPQAGPYYITVYGFNDYSNVTLTARYDTTGVAVKTVSNSNNVSILNQLTVNSLITSNYTNAAGVMTIDVDIKHTDVNSLEITVIAPNNQSFNLKNVTTTSDATNIAQSFNRKMAFTIPANISNGVWRLDVKDTARLDTGYINSWKISLP